MFRALVLPAVDYANTMWNPHTLKNIFTLETIQNHGACWVCGSSTAIIVTHGLSLPAIVVMSSIGHLFLLVICTLQLLSLQYSSLSYLLALFYLFHIFQLSNKITLPLFTM